MNAAGSEGNDALGIKKDLDNTAILRSVGFERRVLLKLSSVEGSYSAL